MQKVIAGAIPAKKLWILDAKWDLFLFVLTPLWILPLMLWLKPQFTVSAMASVVLGLGGLGHHLPGWLRAYGDPQIRHDYFWRITLGPIIIIGTCILFALLNLGALPFIFATWGTWHGATQVHGFHRIYDAKVGSDSAFTRRLDLWVCLFWFIAAILHSPGKMVAMLGSFYMSGGALIPVSAWTPIRQAWDVLTLATTLVFVAWTAKEAWSGRPVSWIKWLAMVTSIGFWWFTVNAFDEIVYGVLVWEIFHDVQYNALVWVMGRAKVAKGLATGRFERFLYQPMAWKFLLFLVMIFAYGSLGIWMGYDRANGSGSLLSQTDNTVITLFSRIIVASALVHFYFDSFIWRVRAPSFRQELAIIPADRKPDPPPGPRGLQHAWKWILFVAPVTWLGMRDYADKHPPMVDLFRNLSQVMPENWGMHYLAGISALNENKTAEALRELSEVVRLKPDEASALYNLGILHIESGDWKSAEAELKQSLKYEPNEMDAVRQLALLLSRQGRYSEAMPYLQKAVSQDTIDLEIARQLAASYLTEKQIVKAREILEQLVNLDGEDGWIWNHLGLTQELSGDKDAARAIYLRAVQAARTFFGGQENLDRLDSLSRLKTINSVN